MNEEVDHLYLDRASCRTLLSWLRDLAWLLAELEKVTTRQTRYTGRSERRAADTPVVFNPAASDLAFEIRDVCLSWVSLVAEVRRLPAPGVRDARAAAAWLREHVMDLAQVEPAFDAYEEVRDLHRRAMRMVDRPEEQEFVGPCQSDVEGIGCDGVYARRGADTKNCSACGVCVDVPSVMAATRTRMEDRLYSAAELTTALTVFCGRRITRPTVDRWIATGKLSPRPGESAPVYALDEGAALVSKMRKPRVR
jgi:hypothetical protein